MSTNDKKNALHWLDTSPDMTDTLVRGAYMSARANAPDYGWMGAISAGVDAFKTNYEANRNLKKLEHDQVIGEIDKICEEVYNNGGSLPKEYFDQAYTYTEGLREEYLEAVKSGDKSKQHQIKAQLNTFSQGIEQVKTSVVEAASTWQDDYTVDHQGLTTEQKSILKSITGTNAVLGDDGIYKWKAIDINGNPILDENGQQKYYTEEDLGNALPMRDDVSKEAYLESNNTIIENRQKWLNGEGDDFSWKTNYDANMKLINSSIKDNGSIQSMVWDDVTGQGSFVESLDKHPDFESIFDNINNTEHGMSNLKLIALHDKTDDGVVDFRDFISKDEFPAYWEKVDTDQDGVLDKDELEAIKNNPELLKEVTVIAKNKLKEAITMIDHPNYDEDLTKSLIGDFLTNRQSQMFYKNDTKGIDYKTLVPDPNNQRSGNVTYNNATGVLKIGKQVINSLKAYQDLGGSYGYLKAQGYTYDDKNNKWLYNPPFKGSVLPTKIDLPSGGYMSGGKSSNVKNKNNEPPSR